MIERLIMTFSRHGTSPGAYYSGFCSDSDVVYSTKLDVEDDAQDAAGAMYVRSECYRAEHALIRGL